MLHYEDTAFMNVRLVIGGNGAPCGVEYDGEIKYRVGDSVMVTPDDYGYICPGITKPGKGRIKQIDRDSADHFFIVVTEYGEEGKLKRERIKRIPPIDELKDIKCWQAEDCKH